MAEVMEVENVENQDCEFISEKMSEDELCQKFNISLNCLKKQLHSLGMALTREVKKETTEGQ